MRSPVASTLADNTRRAEPHGTSSPADIQQLFVRAADLQFAFAGVTLVLQFAGLVLMLAATLWQSRGRDAK